MVTAARTKDISLIQYDIKNKTLRSQFAKTQERNVQGEINTFGLVATEAAYRESEAWLEELLSYLEANRTFVCDSQSSVM